MILALIIEAFKLSFIFGGTVVFVLICMNLIHIFLTKVLPLPVVFVVRILDLIYKKI